MSNKPSLKNRGEQKKRRKRNRSKLTNLIEFKSVIFGAHFGQETLCGFAVGAIGFTEDGCKTINISIGFVEKTL